MNRTVGALILAGWLLWPLGLAAQIAPDPSGPEVEKPLTDEEFHLPLDANAAAEVDLLIPQLNSPQSSEREKATERLVELGAATFSKLRSAYAQSDDLEVQLRISQVVRTAYLNRHVFDKYGFLGVQLQSLDAAAARKQNQNPNRPMIPPPAPPQSTENALQIGRVIADTAAARAGLQAEDVVYSLNGIPVVGAGNEAVNKFSANIRTFPPGAKITLDIERNGVRMKVDAVIGRCPEESARARSVGFWPEYGKVCARFEEWWKKYFLSQAAASTESSDSTK